MNRHNPSKALVARLAFACVLGLASTILIQPQISARAQESEQTFSDAHLRLGAQLAELLGANEIYISALNAQRRDIIRFLGSNNPDIVDVVTEVADVAYLDMVDTTGPLFEEIAKAHASVYSEAELSELVEFFGSEVGSKFLETRRAVNQTSVEITFAWGDTINSVFLARVRALLAERGVQL